MYTNRTVYTINILIEQSSSTLILTIWHIKTIYDVYVKQVSH